VKLVPLLLLAWISSGAAQTFHIEPASPILVGEPLSIRVDGLPADRSVTFHPACATSQFKRMSSAVATGTWIPRIEKGPNVV